MAGAASLRGLGLCQPVAEWPSPEPVRRPQVVILSTQVAKDGTIIVETQVEDPAGGQVELNVLLDGQPLRAVAVAQGGAWRWPIATPRTVTPPRRDGVLSLVARNRESESSPAQLRIRRGAPERRPALYVLSVGVGRYRSPDIPHAALCCQGRRGSGGDAAAPARPFVSRITVRVLTDAQASREAIVAGPQVADR